MSKMSVRPSVTRVNCKNKKLRYRK